MALVKPDSNAGKIRAAFEENPSLSCEDVAKLLKQPLSTVKIVMHQKHCRETKKSFKLQGKGQIYRAKITPENKNLVANQTDIRSENLDFIANNKLGYLEGNIVQCLVHWQAEKRISDLNLAQKLLVKLIEVNS